MPRINDRVKKAILDREEQIEKAMQAYRLNFFTIAEAAIAFNLPKSTLAHRLNGRQSNQKAQEEHQVISPSAENAIVKWILKKDKY
jgi:hypothetical protein